MLRVRVPQGVQVGANCRSPAVEALVLEPTASRPQPRDEVVSVSPAAEEGRDDLPPLPGSSQLPLAGSARVGGSCWGLGVGKKPET